MRPRAERSLFPSVSNASVPSRNSRARGVSLKVASSRSASLGVAAIRFASRFVARLSAAPALSLARLALPRACCSSSMAMMTCAVAPALASFLSMSKSIFMRCAWLRDSSGNGRTAGSGPKTRRSCGPGAVANPWNAQIAALSSRISDSRGRRGSQLLLDQRSYSSSSPVMLIGEA